MSLRGAKRRSNPMSLAGTFWLVSNAPDMLKGGMPKSSAIALLSSGLDSALAAALAQREGTEITYALTFDYGQRACRQEQKQAAKIAEYLNVPHKVLRLPWFDEFSKRGLLSENSPLPQPNAKELNETAFIEKSAAAVWVPNRNGVFLEVAASLAENVHADFLIVGFNAEEAATFPDNSQDYLEAINRALSFSTANHVRVLSPTAALNKREIVRRGKEIGFPFELLWSCYENSEHMCGSCESCMRLKRALRENEVNVEAFFKNSTL
jgi:7-cyano-7-deazaguanine synthase